MTARLIYVMGPSGAGKDTLLAWLRDHLPIASGVHFARRTITRATLPGDEQHHSVDVSAFLQLRQAGTFGLDWQANGLHYGIAHSQLTGHPAGDSVVVNGSRAYLARALENFPDMAVVHVTASLELLRRRLIGRGREDPAAVEARVMRAAAFRLPAGATSVEIYNDGSVREAGGELLRAVQRWTHPHRT